MVQSPCTLNPLAAGVRRREAGGSLNRLLLGHPEPKKSCDEAL